MEWKNAVSDRPPADGDEVLISVEGVYYFATFDKAMRTFAEANEKAKEILARGV